MIKRINYAMAKAVIIPRRVYSRRDNLIHGTPNGLNDTNALQVGERRA